jgi:tRNA(fMet)-specific endonuclease VapC
MRLLLDTNTLSYFLKGHRQVRERLQEAVDKDFLFLLSSVVHYELRRYLNLKGAHRLLRAYEETTASWTRCSLSFDDWEEASRVWAERHRLGRSIADLDLFLAVLARREKAVLVTSNTRHFEGLGIPCEDWMSPA